jgi:hypothetical protein
VPTSKYLNNLELLFFVGDRSREKVFANTCPEVCRL